jgi:4'-phosphopantetheinyl transferase
MPLITCNHIERITWLDACTPASSSKRTLDLWRFRVAQDPKLLQYAYGLLQPEERERSARYRIPNDQHRFITARAGLRVLLGKYLNEDPAQIRFAEGPGKKPFARWTAGTAPHYNTAHSGNWILIALSSLEVGVDVEKVNPEFDYHEVLQMTCSQEEIKVVEASPDPRRSFYLLWTRKEALVKATAKGLDDALIGLPSMNGTHEVAEHLLGSSSPWTVRSFALDSHYVASLAYHPSIETIQFYDSTRAFAVPA